MHGTVLVVESDNSLRQLLEEILNSLDYRVVSRASVLTDAGSLAQPKTGWTAVFWSASCLEQLAEYTGPQPGVDETTWILVAGSEETDSLPQGFVQRLYRPFRVVDVSAVLNGEQAPDTGDDPVLKFMRRRESEFESFRKKESQLRGAHKHMKELERMKNTFLSLVSHELRTPLTIISGNLHVLKKLASKWDNHIANECLGSANEGTRRLSKLVDELLRFTVSVPQKRDRWDLALTLRRLVGELSNLAESRGLDLNLECPSLPIEGDPAGLPDALHQLIENALLFNNPGGKVEVVGKYSETEGWLEIQITDDGPGIDQAELDKVFHPFYQVADVNTRTVEGLGIGLALARRTIESHGGRLDLRSIVDTGTKATVTLPTRSQQAIPFPANSSSPRPPAKDDINGLRDYAQELYELLEAEKVRRRHAEEQKLVLEQTFIETLVSLIRMVDPRVSGGTSQGERVLDYARAVTRHLDPTLLSRPEFLYGLLLYDIGKIGVAETVLSKTGSLTEQEKRNAQAHSEIGADLLTSVGVLQPAIDAVRSHHEKWDGSGYPDGLKGQDIPILARVIAVVDSFDAMTVDRPYRVALELDKAREQIMEGSGSVFDPSVVEAFVRAWEEIRRVSQRANSGSARPTGSVAIAYSESESASKLS